MSSVLRFTTLWLALSCLGCAGTSWGRKQTADQSADRRAASQGTKTASKSSSPTSRRSPAPDGDAGESVASKSAKPPKSTDPERNPFRDPAESTASRTVAKSTSPKTGSSDNRFSPELQALIDSELRDATPDERAEWIDQLRQVDPTLVPNILRARRLTQQVVDAHPGTPARRESHDSTSQPGWDHSSSADRRTVSSRPTNSRRSSDRLEESSGVEWDRSSGESEFDERLADGVRRYGGSRESNRTPNPRNVAYRSTPEHATDVSHDRHDVAPRADRKTGPRSPHLPGSPITPASATSDADSGIDLDEIAALREQDLMRRPPSDPQELLRRHVELRLLYFLAGRHERALAAIPGVDATDQEFWQQMIWSMVEYFDAEQMPSSEARAGQALVQLRSASRRLQDRAPLELHSVCFCQQISYYGNFERFPRDEFIPGQEVLLYAEVENFKSELSNDGQFRTLLKSTIELATPSGDIRKRFDFPATEDSCRNPRRDYFHNYQFTVPDRMPSGPYVLKLTVTDELSGKSTTSTVNFAVR